MRRRGRWALAVFALCCTCARLPEIASGECGNGVIEPPEDCDTFDADGGTVCRPKGAVGECRLDCGNPTDDGTTACPVGWGCDASGICRRPTGEFEPAREFEVGSAEALLHGDFDGDGSDDVLSLETRDALGFTRFQVHYFDARAALSETRAFPRAVIAPVVEELSADRRSDIVFSDLSVGALLGRADRNWVPETFSSYRIPDTSIRTLTVFADPIQQTGGFIIFATFEGVAGIYVADGQDAGFPRLLGALDGPIEMLVGDPVSGRVIRDETASPCRQAAVALRGATELSLFDACGRDPATGQIFWLPALIETRIRLDPPAPIDAAPQLVDVNADGNLDALVGAAGRVYVAYGDGTTLATASPYALPLGSGGNNPDPEIPMPLAAADLTGDGALDFVFGGGMFLSVPGADAALFDYVQAPAPGPGSASMAVIADLNGNGKLDVATASKDRPGITFFNGTGTRDLTFFSIPTSRPVQHLAVGDFDGDQIDDLAFTQNDASQGAPSSVMIAFGAVSGPPSPPAPVARLDNIEQIHAYREGALGHLLLTSAQVTEERRSGVLTLLIGSGDRIPVALYELTRFGTDSSTLASAAYRTLAGDFTGPGQHDVLALAAAAEVTDTPEFWLLPALTTSPGTPVQLSGGLPPILHPVSSTDSGDGLSLATATADIDTDGRDEALFAMPAEDANHCGLLISTVEPTKLVERALIGIDEPCSKVELLPMDMDNDGFVDVALLTGRLDGSERQLSIFWNDGRGGFDRERRTLVADATVSARAFAVLPPTPALGVSLVYATRDGVERVSLGEDPRALGSPSLLAPVRDITGITAADLNGDGAVDLALAARGNLNILRAALEAL